jgi:hypothetical protein
MPEQSTSSFDETAVLERLRKAPRVASPTPRLVRVDRAAYLEAEEDPDRQAELEQATRELVERLGGRLGKVSQQAQGRRAGRTYTPPPTVVWFYELAAAALEPSEKGQTPT